jgi:dTDP-4-dehydrorhamnose 3,5-epimerase/reductase
MSGLTVTPTEIAGLYSVDLVVHPDPRGSFREAYQREKLEALGLPPLGPVQWNISENLRRGILRGVHAEPWDKYIHVIAGEVFAAISDLRRGSPTFGRALGFRLDRGKALFVSKGLGNAYQVTSDGAVYGYLVNAHWTPGTTYLGVAWNDPDLAIPWPLPVGPDDLSGKDRSLPTLREALGE